MPRTIARLAALVIAGVAFLPASAQAAGSSWSGTVINCLHGAPVANAPVAIDRAGRSGRADANGNFVFYNLPNGGSYRVTASAVHATYGAMSGASGSYILMNANWRENVVIRPAQRWRCLPHLA
jgi:hypothetical protein